MGRRGVDLGPDGGTGADERGDLGREREGVADRGAGLEPGGHADHRDAVGAGELGDLAAGRGDDPLRADGLGGRVAGDGLLRVARVAGAEDGAIGARPGRDAVRADDVERLAEPRAERGGGKIAPDRRAAHPADDEPGGLDRFDIGGGEAPEGIAQVLGEGERSLELVAGIVCADAFGQVAHRLDPLRRSDGLFGLDARVRLELGLRGDRRAGADHRSLRHVGAVLDDDTGRQDRADDGGAGSHPASGMER